MDKSLALVSALQTSASGHPIADAQGCAEWSFLYPNPMDLRIRTIEKKALSVGVIGFGYWGPNIVRNFHSQDDSQVSMVCDHRPEALAKAAKAYPGIEVTSDALQILSSPKIDIVAVVTPVWTHFDLAKAALEQGKHVFVEKPFTSTAEQAEELIALAERKHLKIMVDHTFLFTGAVRKIKQLIDSGELGDHLLLRHHASEPWPVPAQRKCYLGSRAPRSVHHGLSTCGQSRSGGRDRPKARKRCRGYRVHHRLLP